MYDFDLLCMHQPVDNAGNPIICITAFNISDDDFAVDVDRLNETLEFDWNLILPETKIDGYHCNKCNDYCQFAEPNQLDGSFTCWRCRNC